jgi:hypothetical protein
MRKLWAALLRLRIWDEELWQVGRGSTALKQSLRRRPTHTRVAPKVSVKHSLAQQ